MITFSSRAFLSRIERLPKSLISSVYAPRYFQGAIKRAKLKSFTTMNVAKGDLNQTGSQKRQEAIKQVWETISTEAISKQVNFDEKWDSTCVQSSAIAESSNTSLVEMKDGNHSITIEVDALLMRFARGKGGSVQNQIEEELGVKIIFPSSKEETSLAIEGNNPENLTKASEKITHILNEAVKSPNLDYSHFISLPLAVHSDLIEKLNEFQSRILCNEDNSETKIKDLEDLGIDKSIFIKPNTFHLTVLMLKLWNEERVALASEVLQKISSKVMEALENRPVAIQLKGLTCMKGSPAKARVLYMPVFEIGDEGRLIKACQVIIDAFVESGLVLEKDAKQSLKLHATVMNVRHRKSNNKKRWNDSFDARNIFNKYESEEWGEYPINEVHLSQRFRFDQAGYYHCCSSISLPHKK
ncbi:hypothetical protein LUZ60_010007 [Juncus effusus]|nr:hypothetical protein LUZ60_010007 [Juncus effusus]